MPMCIINGRYAVSRDLLRLVWRQMITSYTLDALQMTKEINLQLHRKPRTRSWCCRISTFGLHYAELSKNSTCVLWSVLCTKSVSKKKRLCGDGYAKERWKISLEDACKELLAQILEGDCLEMQKLALFLLCRFLHFWLRYAAITGITPRVFWWTMQRCLNPILKKWEFLQEATVDSCERA